MTPEQREAAEILKAWKDPAVRAQHDDDILKFQCRRRWDSDPKLRAEFKQFDWYLSYSRAKGLAGSPAVSAPALSVHPNPTVGAAPKPQVSTVSKPEHSRVKMGGFYEARVLASSQRASLFL